MKLGVVIVVFNSADFILYCVNSLLASDRPINRIVLCDNASPDTSVNLLRNWASETGVDWTELPLDIPPSALRRVSLVRAGNNLGFAGGVNVGLRALVDDGCDLIWLLNPDAIVQRHTAGAIVSCANANPGFGLMGGRIIYSDPQGVIQSDGGRLNRWTGMCSNVNQGKKEADAIRPAHGTLDFVSGAHLVASRRFVEKVGPMSEDYFLYYEEVDWAARRGTLPLIMCEDATILHHGGTAIGTGAVNRSASALANYFNFRNRIRFMQRFHARALPAVMAYSAAKIVKILLSGGTAEAASAWRGLFGLAAPKAVAAQIAPEARSLAFDRNSST